LATSPTNGYGPDWNRLNELESGEIAPEDHAWLVRHHFIRVGAEGDEARLPEEARKRYLHQGPLETLPERGATQAATKLGRENAPGDNGLARPVRPAVHAHQAPLFGYDY